jgi:hypothetical protein
MGKINVGRVILGGIVAGIVYNLLDLLVDGVLLASSWDAGLKALGHTGISTNDNVWFWVIGFIGGIVAVWLYAAIRPRFGAGVKTAVYAGLVTWIFGFVLPNAVFMGILHLFSRHLALYTTLGALVEAVVATIAGAALYKEA